MKPLSERVSNYEQRYNGSCGMSSVMMVLRAFGNSASEDAVITGFQQVMNAPVEFIREEGATWAEMIVVITKSKLKYDYHTHATYEQLMNAVNPKSLIIVSWMSDRKKTDVGGHYSVVRAVDKDLITVYDPAWGDRFTMRRPFFEKRWFDEETRGAFMSVFK